MGKHKTTWEEQLEKNLKDYGGFPRETISKIWEEVAAGWIGGPPSEIMKPTVGYLLSIDLTRRCEELFEVLNMCESPIEQAFAMAFVCVGTATSGGVRHRLADGHLIGDWGMPSFFVISPQAQIGSYRVDFLIELIDQLPCGEFKSQIIVECDGHDFHERTKEQAKKDRSKDRALQSLGFEVFRFTGSEIWKDAEKCAREASTRLHQMVRESFEARSKQEK